MNINQSSENLNNTDFLNQFFSSFGITEKNSSSYIIPGFSGSEPSDSSQRATRMNLFAALFGLAHPFRQIILQLSEQKAENLNKTDKFFFWVKKPDHVSDTDFEHCIEKICDHFHVQSKCLIKLSDQQTDVHISTDGMIKKVNLDVAHLAEYLMFNFWPLFEDKPQQDLEIHLATQEDAISEPQTIFGKWARQLKADQILEELNLSGHERKAKRH
ncbi:hypothetical protein [Acinetobacter sp. CAAS 2-6]|uniref:hypothetical protein n=1 Tax=Acinetobacter sp. CAAS 2-6 TaxID=3016358 RepID=UPI002DD67FDD|nr:hypothetical protein [Acinetobacter sp. CAAS 2-6]